LDSGDQKIRRNLISAHDYLEKVTIPKFAKFFDNHIHVLVKVGEGEERGSGLMGMQAAVDGGGRRREEGGGRRREEGEEGEEEVED
jgi:hypothetical protein